MPLGICTRYQNHEATHVAIRLARWALSRGYAASLYPTTPGRIRIENRWDVLANGQRGRSFTDWAREQTTIVWTHVPIPEQITWSRKQGINTVLLPLWHELHPSDRDALQACECVISPCQEAAKLIAKRWGVKRSYAVPWDAGLPFTAKDSRLRLNHQWLLLPLYDQEPCKTEMTSIEIAGRALWHFPNTVLSVMYNSSTMGSPAKRRLGRFAKMFKGRVHLMPGVPAERRPLIFRSHDLTIWPTQRENTGLVGLTSITMGTPVIAFAASPTDELLSHNNSIPVACVQTTKPSGVPIPEPDYAAFEIGLSTMLAQPERLRQLQQTVHTGLTRRRDQFNAAMSNIHAE